MAGYITTAHDIAQRLSEKWRHFICTLLSSLFCTSPRCVGVAHPHASRGLGAVTHAPRYLGAVRAARHVEPSARSPSFFAQLEIPGPGLLEAVRCSRWAVCLCGASKTRVFASEAVKDAN